MSTVHEGISSAVSYMHILIICSSVYVANATSYPHRLPVRTLMSWFGTLHLIMSLYGSIQTPVISTLATSQRALCVLVCVCVLAGIYPLITLGRPMARGRHTVLPSMTFCKILVLIHTKFACLLACLLLQKEQSIHCNPPCMVNSGLLLGPILVRLDRFPFRKDDRYTEGVHTHW